MTEIQKVIDTWEPCKFCKDRESPCLENDCAKNHGGNMDCSRRCIEYAKWTAMRANISFNNFCPHCGRPLTDEARKSMEKRIENGLEKKHD